MAIHRETPTCPFCGKPTAKAIYKDQSNVPWFMQMIGDTFIRWEEIKHSCKGMKQFEKECKKAAKESGLDKLIQEIRKKEQTNGK
jgi:hypothetical protein